MANKTRKTRVIENGDDKIIKGQIIKVECNLEEYPFFLLSDRDAKNKNKITFERQIKTSAGKPITQKWYVMANSNYGLPTSFDQDVFVTLMTIYNKQGCPKDGIVWFSFYKLVQIMDREEDGRIYDRLNESLERLTLTGIKSENSFYLNKKETYLRHKKVFTLFTDLDSKGRDRRLELVGAVPFWVKDTTIALQMSKVLLESWKQNNIKSFNPELYFSLKSGQPKREYRLLDKKRYGKNTYEIGLEKYADLLPLTYRYPSEVMRYLDKSHKELQDAKFLKDCELKQKKDGYKLILHFDESQVIPVEKPIAGNFNHSQKKEEDTTRTSQSVTSPPHSKEKIEVRSNPQSSISQPSNPVNSADPEKEKIFTQLKQFGLKPSQLKNIEQLLKTENLSDSFLQEKIKEYLSAKEIVNPPPGPGWLYKSIMEQWNKSNSLSNHMEKKKNREELEKIKSENKSMWQALIYLPDDEKQELEAEARHNAIINCYSNGSNGNFNISISIELNKLLKHELEFQKEVAAAEQAQQQILKEDIIDDDLEGQREQIRQEIKESLKRDDFFELEQLFWKLPKEQQLQIDKQIEQNLLSLLPGQEAREIIKQKGRTFQQERNKLMKQHFHD